MEHMSDGDPPRRITAHMPTRVRMSSYDVSLRNAVGRVSSIARGGGYFWLRTWEASVLDGRRELGVKDCLMSQPQVVPSDPSTPNRHDF